MHSSKGFTVVELIASLILVGLLSATAMSRWFGTDSFEESGATNQLVAQARLAQRIALAHATVDIHFQVSRVGSDWRYAIIRDDGGTLTTLHQLDVEAPESPITVTAAGTPQVLSASVSLDLQFDSLGNASILSVGGTPLSTAEGILMSFSSNHQICISPLGYAHGGSCV